MAQTKRVIIIDDDKTILRVFSLILQRNGYNVDTAETGHEALKKLHQVPYDVALIDVILPDANGLNLLKNIPSKTKKIVITGTQREESMEKVIAERADAYMLKPVNPEKLLQLIAN